MRGTTTSRRLVGALAAALITWGAPSLAQAEAPRVMTLPEAIAHARARQPALRAMMARVTAEEQAARIPRSEWLPSIGVTAQIFAATANNTTGTYVGAPNVDVPRIGGTRVASPGSMQPYPSVFVGAGVRQEIFDFGRIAARAAAADALVDVARLRAAVVRLDLDFAVESAFFAVQAARAVEQAAAEAQERARVHRDMARAAVEAGMRPPLERTRAEADLARFDIGLERARAGLALSQSVFAAAVGVAEPALDAPREVPALRDLPSMAEALRQAAARDPRILEAEARARASELATRAIAAEARPNLALTSSISLRAGGAPPSGTGDPARGGGFAPEVPNWDVGLVLTWPLWSGVNAAREREASARVAASREDLAAVRHERAVAVQQAALAVRVAAAALPALDRSVEAARANYAQAEARFASGLGNSVELADAEQLRAQAEIDRALGRFDLSRARITFGRAIAEEP